MPQYTKATCALCDAPILDQEQYDGHMLFLHCMQVWNSMDKTKVARITWRHEVYIEYDGTIDDLKSKWWMIDLGDLDREEEGGYIQSHGYIETISAEDADTLEEIVL